MSSIFIQKPIYQFLQPTIEADWDSLLPYLSNLNDRILDIEPELLKWLKDKSELEAFLEENFAWRYIRMTSDTANEEYSKAFRFFAEEIEPKIAPWNDILNKKLMGSSALSSIEKEPYLPFLKKIKSQIELYREENIPLFTELQIKQQEYAKISGAMSVKIQGKVYTMEQAATFLKDQNRDVRKEAFEKIAERRLKDVDAIQALLEDLIELRQKVARNAGFDNFRDYSYKALGRFDYGPKEANQFQEAIRLEIVPLLKVQAENRRKALGLEDLKPWDMDVDISLKPALKPFQNGEELIDKSIACFQKIDPFFGECLSSMKKEGFFDVESRAGKAPGGYNYPLAESGAPFIFMNSANSFRDLTTMVHEGGHAVHTFLSRNLPLNDFKHLTSEIAELASMSMELISMKYWDIFFPNPEDLKRAKKDQLIDSLKTFPWVAIIDKFQDRMYTEKYSPESLIRIWNQIYQEFGGGFCDWTGFEDYRDHIWQKQLHIFEVPFYYIEYGIAGLGAIAVWKNFVQDPAKAIQSYKNALSLGYTLSIPETYQRAGIRFDMSQAYIAELAGFVQSELEAKA